MSTQHTPGPWSLNTQYADIEVRGPAASGVLIAVMSPWGLAADAPSPQLANARLIAAAPETARKAMEFTLLIEKCMRNGCPDEGIVAAALYELRAHIAAATGEAAEPQPEPIPTGEATDSDFGAFEDAAR